MANLKNEIRSSYITWWNENKWWFIFIPLVT